MTYAYGCIKDEALFNSLNMSQRLLSGADDDGYLVHDELCQELVDRYDQEGMLRLCEKGILLPQVVVPLLDDSDTQWYTTRVLRNPNNAIRSLGANWPHKNQAIRTQVTRDR